VAIFVKPKLTYPNGECKPEEELMRKNLDTIKFMAISALNFQQEV